jgi:hypothetical protein
MVKVGCALSRVGRWTDHVRVIAEPPYAGIACSFKVSSFVTENIKLRLIAALWQAPATCGALASSGYLRRFGKLRLPAALWQAPATCGALASSGYLRRSRL